MYNIIIGLIIDSKHFNLKLFIVNLYNMFNTSKLFKLHCYAFNIEAAIEFRK